MSLLSLFKLAKLTINAFSDPERQSPLGKPFEVQYNPESFSMRYESVFQDEQGVGSPSSDGEYAYTPSKRLTVDLVVDGTNVGYMGVELLLPIPSVADQINAFLDACYKPQSDTHEPAYLKLEWGQGPLSPSFECRLESVDISYTAFDRDGSPLHARLNAVFVGREYPPRRSAALAFASPDLTHRRVVAEGDTLPLLCRQIYGSASYYLRVAQANGLDDFRNLTPGQELLFPPFEKAGRG